MDLQLGTLGTLGWPKLFQGGVQVVVCALWFFFCKDFLALAGVLPVEGKALAAAVANWIKESSPVEGKALATAVAS